MPNLARLAQMAEVAERVDLLWAGIFSPDLGDRQDVPKIMLPQAYTAESVNILMRDGELGRMKGRLPETVESEFAIGTVTATNGSATITASGGAGAWGTSATHKPCWGSDQVSGDGRTIQIYDDGAWHSYTVKDVADNGATLTLTANYDETGGGGLDYKIGTLNQKIPTPDGNPVLRYHRLETTDTNIEYLMCFTKCHAYLWSVSWSAWMLKFTGGSDCTRWSTAEFKNQIIATNNVDKVQIWGSTVGNLFAKMGGASGIDVGGEIYITLAAAVYVYENYVLLGNLERGGTRLPESLNWCSKDDETDFDQTGTGDCGDGTLRGGGALVGFATYGGFLVIAKKRRMFLGSLVVSSVVFNFDAGDDHPDVGCCAPETLIRDRRGRLYWLDDHFKWREWRDGIISGPKDKTFRNINPELAPYSKATFVDSYNQIWLSIPHWATATGNNKVVILDPEEKRWSERDIAVSAFGDYTRQTVYTWPTLPFETYTGWGWDDWRGPENVLGFPLDLASDYSGYTYDLHSAEKDDSSAYTGHFVLSTDGLQKILVERYGKQMRYYKRLAVLKLFFRREAAGTVAVSIKRDGERNFQQVGNASLVDNTEQRDWVEPELTPDLRARSHEIKISGAVKFQFLGCLLGYTMDGMR